jgi:uncharacterized repeat protein (TIGR02543 family)
MKKKVLFIAFVIFMLFSVADVYAVGTYGVNTDSEAYGEKNQYKDYRGECTWYACGRAYEKTGTEIYWRTGDGRLGNAKEWLTCAANYGYKCGTEPRVNSVIVWTGGTYGHVAYIEDIVGNTLYISESNRIYHTYSEGTIDTSTWKYTGTFNDNGSNTVSIPAGYIYFDTTAPTVSSYVDVSDVSSDGFTLSFEVTDDKSGVAMVYADVSPGSAQTGATRINGEINGSTATINVDASLVNALSGSNSNHYYVTCYAKDKARNTVEIHIEHERISLYKVKVKTGTYKTKQDTAVHFEPCEEIDGRTTETTGLAKGACVSVIGEYKNAWNATYLLMSDGQWVYADHMEYQMQWSDIWDAICNFVTGNSNENKIFYFAGQATVAVSETKGNSTKSVSSPKSVNLMASDSVNGAIRIYGNVRNIPADVEPVSIPSYTVNFDANGGSVSFSQKKVFSNSAYGTLPTPYRAGYTFNGWYTERDGGTRITGYSICGGNITLYANWERNILLSGQCGYNVYYCLYSDGLLEITGSGNMTSNPWLSSVDYIANVNISEGVTNITERAFAGCYNLKSVTISDSVSIIGSLAFYNCTSLNSVKIGKGLKKLQYGYIDGLRVGIFEGCSDFSLTIGCDILDYMFKGLKNLTSLTVIDGSSSIGNGAFYECSNLTSVTISNSVKRIGEEAFKKCNNINSIIIPDSVTCIESYAFEDCTSLTSVTIGKGLKEYQYGVFE